MLKAYANQIRVGVLLGLFGFIQTPLFLNVQLLIYKASLFPKFETVSALDAMFLIIASLHLIIAAESLKKADWWIGFTAMIVPYLILKWIGVYFDHTNYIIAEAEGRTIGGGAAMGHLLLLFYIFGPAQMVSFLGSFLAKKFTKDNSTR